MRHRPEKLGLGGVVVVFVAAALQIKAPPVLGQLGDEAIVNSVGMRFVQIPRGAFEMGTPESDEYRQKDEHAHSVQISRSFHLSSFEVTQKQYQMVMGRNPSFFKATGAGSIKIKTKSTQQFPVEDVTWHQAVEFCRKLSQNEDEKFRKFTYRLPTEAEWEYACRAGTTTPLSFGEDISSYEVNFNGIAPLGRGRSGPFLRAPWSVGGYKANAFGLYDMHGNVMEWVSDWYDSDYYRSSPKADPTGAAKGVEKVVRGGGWSNTARGCRSAARHKFPPDLSSYNIGFRVVLVMENDGGDE